MQAKKRKVNGLPKCLEIGHCPAFQCQWYSEVLLLDTEGKIIDPVTAHQE